MPHTINNPECINCGLTRSTCEMEGGDKWVVNCQDIQGKKHVFPLENAERTGDKGRVEKPKLTGSMEKRFDENWYVGEGGDLKPDSFYCFHQSSNGDDPSSEIKFFIRQEITQALNEERKKIREEIGEIDCEHDECDGSVAMCNMNDVLSVPSLQDSTNNQTK